MWPFFVETLAELSLCSESVATCSVAIGELIWTASFTELGVGVF